MRKKWKLRVISWILAIMMVLTSPGLDSLTVQAAEADTNESVQVEEVPAELQTDEDAFTCTVDFEAGYTIAKMTFTLDTIGGLAPTGSNNIDVFIKAHGDENTAYKQTGWYQGLNEENQVVFSNFSQITMNPDTEYDVRIDVRHDNNVIGSTVKSFRTKKLEVTLSVEEKTWFFAEFKASVTDTAKAELEEEGFQSFRVFPYIQAKGGDTSLADIGGYGVDLFEGDFTVKNLADDTEYTLYLSRSATSATPYFYQYGFKTDKDQRSVSLTNTQIQYCYAKFDVSVSGGRDDVDTKCYLFYRKKGASQWNQQVQNETAEAFSKSFTVNNLDACTEYEYVLAIGDEWNINNPDVFTKEGHKITGTFTTPEDPRELKISGSAGYQTALFKGSYTENNLSGVQCVIHVFVRKKGGTEWTEVKNASYDQANTFDFLFTGLEQDTEYEYRAILNSKWNETTADDSVRPLQYAEGTFKTNSCQYTLTVKPNTEKSVYNREYLDVQLNDSKQDREVELYMLFSNDAEKTISLYRDETYKDIFSLRELSSNTTYYVEEYSLFVKEYGERVCIKTVTCEETDYAFTTPTAQAPTSVEFETTEVYLNAAQPKEDKVGCIVLKPIVNEGASNEMLWESSDETVATVDAKGKVTAKAIGEATITAKSKYSEAVTATVQVHVGSFQAVYASNSKAVGDATVKGLKGTTSEAIIVTGTDSSDVTGAQVDITGFSLERNSVATYDLETNLITFGAVGTTKLYLHKDNYKVRVNTESYIKSAAYYVAAIDHSDYPGVEMANRENTFVLAANQTKYQLVIKTIDGSEIKSANNFDITIDPNSNVTMSGKKLELTTGAATTSVVKMTISPKEGTEYDNEYYTDAVIYIHVKELPEANNTTRCVYLNEDKFLSDVDLKSGWKWENEGTCLYALKKTQDYTFDAYYAKEDCYPMKQAITLSLAEIKNFKVEDMSRTNYNVTAGGEDKILIRVSFSYDGKIDSGDLSKYLQTDAADCTIEREVLSSNWATFRVSAARAGSYTLKAGVFSTEYDKAIAEETVTLTAKENPYVRSIQVKNTFVDPAELLTKNELLLDSTVYMGQTVTLQAITYDYAQNEIQASELIWSSSDKSVVEIAPAGSEDTQNAKLIVKGEGNARITVKSTDAAGAEYSFSVEVQNIAPRFDTAKVTVNTALDYTIPEGRNIAYQFYGYTEVVEAYKNKITKATLYQKTQKTFEQESTLTASTYFEFYDRKSEGKTGYGSCVDILPIPKNPDLPKGKYELWLAIETENSSHVYTWPITVTVVNKPMKVKAVSDNINTFYMLRENDDIAYTFTGEYLYNPTVNWIDDAPKAIGFGIGKNVYYNQTKKKWCSHVDTSALEMDGKVPAAGTASGKLELMFKGYRKAVTIEKFKIKNSYKLPNITAVDAQSTISTECGINQASFYLYQKDAKKKIEFRDAESKYCFSSYKSNIEEVEVSDTGTGSPYLKYTYTGNNKSEKLVVALRSDYWREKVEVKHSINNVAPTLVLEKPNMMFNWNLPGTDTTVLKVKKAQNGAVLKDVIVTGKNADAQKLIDENVFTFTLGDKTYLDVKLNHLKALNKKMNKDATYSFNVTPVFVNTVTGKDVTGKPCVLKVKTTAKNPEVAVSTSGSIDLAKYPMNGSWEFYKNAIKLKYTIKNVNSNYEVTGREVVGDYAKYFEIWWSDVTQSFYLVAKPGMEGKLKAGFIYNIQFKVTLKMKDGVTTEIISSKPYKLKLKQSTVGVKVTPKSRTFYLCNKEITREYEVALTSGYYHIDSVFGGLDVNSDGEDDFTISNVSKKSGDTAADITLKFVNQDVVTTTAKGKKYTIPVVVRVTGADGVAKDVNTKITVTVKK